MNDPAVLKVHVDDEELLSFHCNLWGLESSMKSARGGSVHLAKTIYCVGRIRIASVNSLSGWGFEGKLENDVYYISNTESGESAWELQKHGRVASSDQISIVDSSKLVAGEFTCRTAMETVVIEADFLHQQLASLQGFPCLQRIEFQPLTGGNYGRVTWAMINSLLQSIKICVDEGLAYKSPLAISHLKQALTLVILERLPHNYQLAGSIADTYILPAHMHKAIDYINANARHDILLSDIANYACTSIRNLQLGFKRYKNTTPLKYLRLVRLQLAHESINKATFSKTWQQIAMSLGFADLRLFSRYYKNVYGQSPTQHQRKTKGI